ncbi:MAG: hypothetical protein OEY40_00865 [Candidatus Bathyarchaeota archaeon]|nr:hypothetical protein [Candidatus Bathyarchaeota archaeon]MDH5595253.1 hypothetical protein [Candidatus Bathyarchaeota archaeon]
MMTRENLEKHTIDEWVKEFSEIYGNVDVKRSPADIWLLLIEDASKVAEYIRTERYADVPESLAHVFCWTCALVWRLSKKNNLHIRFNLQREPFSRIVWHKYPNACSLCGQRHCICSVRRAELEGLSKKEKEKVLKDVERYLEVARTRIENLPKTLDKFASMFGEIYGDVFPIDCIAFHFMEEVGEVSSCIRTLRETSKINLEKTEEDRLIRALKDEIADVFSWTISLLLKLDYLLGAGCKFLKTQHGDEDAEEVKQTVNLKLSSILWKTFQTEDEKSLHCPVCSQRPCQCMAVPF